MNTTKKILITRASEANDEFGEKLTEAGFEVQYFPTISIKPVEDFSQVDKKIKKLGSYDAIFFTSANGVKYFMQRCKELNVKIENKIFAVGEKTKEKIEDYGYKVFYIPETYSAEDLVKSLPPEEVKGKTFLFPRGNLSMKKLKEGLTEFANVDEVEVYINSLPLNGSQVKLKKIGEALKAKEIDCLTFFSPSSITNFMTIFPNFVQKDIKIAVIGNTTKQKAAEYGLVVDILPLDATSVSLAESIIKYFKNNN
jgi:uroporphyrinogen-III synthase